MNTMTTSINSPDEQGLLERLIAAQCAGDRVGVRQVRAEMGVHDVQALLDAVTAIDAEGRVTLAWPTSGYGGKNPKTVKQHDSARWASTRTWRLLFRRPKSEQE